MDWKNNGAGVLVLLVIALLLALPNVSGAGTIKKKKKQKETAEERPEAASTEQAEEPVEVALHLYGRPVIAVWLVGDDRHLTHTGPGTNMVHDWFLAVAADFDLGTSLHDQIHLVAFISL